MHYTATIYLQISEYCIPTYSFQILAPAVLAKRERAWLWIPISGFDSRHILTACVSSDGKEVEVSG